ncbi:hypothetical protein CONPUDRAFT_154008 [Coniophora puteana RWD-64-598 SS2]|uniref:F-box domain-containing protein n=1 Tax=Coniophora puteana (strain RWD-64-598) TaxID=741705 RepID=A0A5M3MS39_CONPW|nr:uncharacterized protein CONPUDRAFT_154008 [Coniophora puteana RWD-64-598 SS2]EIW81465.1 hypothetical protein CONPUDRAFT_154008 [Coniophora puteana RWD-64-598 SS2]
MHSLAQVRINTLMYKAFYPRVSISSLPTETLLTIFKLVHKAVHPSRSSHAFLDFHSPATFPYSCAGVCCMWLDVLAMDRRFWARIIIHIDAPYVTRHVVNTFLATLRMRTIEIYVCYRGAPLMDPDIENRRILTAMECIRPHLSRCSNFTLKGLYRSSTVLASRFFDGVSAPEMNKLTSISVITDTDEPAQITTFYCPKMSQLEVDARSLADFVLAIDGRKEGESRSLAPVACRYRPPEIMDALSPKRFGDALIAGLS